MTTLSRYLSPIGGLLIAASNEEIVGLWFEGQRHFADTIEPEASESELPVLIKARHWLDIYFSGRDPGFTVPVKLTGTPFHSMVWSILQTIPYGKTMSYGEIAAVVAERCGKGKMSAQAVGSAVGHNPVSLIVPCHRVIGSDGSLTGYAAGIDKKRWLLEMEKAI